MGFSRDDPLRAHPGQSRIFELKHDGFRALARHGPHGVQLLSRRCRPLGVAFPEIVAAVAARDARR